MKCGLLLIILLFSIDVLAQKKDSTWIGSFEGIVRDSVHDYELPSATVAVYTAKDTSLVAYQLTDNYGHFQLKQLPTGVPLKIIVTYVGYKKFLKNYFISYAHPSIQHDTLVLETRGEELNEVTVTAPPVELNGDTLEFNAAAFKLDPAAQAEDLLRMLPGVTVWNDGTITVNGRQVSMVLVDGKPFFGGDTKVATQNIPKGAIDKIQVYQQENKLNPLDSATVVNIKLQKNKHNGYFGKLTGGYGTDNRYEAEGTLNYFTPRTQLGAAGAGNNVNKVANDVRTLLRNSTFKGVCANIEYQPELTTQGENKARNGGFTYQHDFIDNSDYFKRNRFNADYFIKDHHTVLDQYSATTTRLTGDSNLYQQSQSSSKNSNTGQALTMKYEKQDLNNNLHSDLSVSTNNQHEQNHSTMLTKDNEMQDISSNSTNLVNHKKSANILLQTGYTHNRAFDDFSDGPREFQIDYTLRIAHDNLDRVNNSVFNVLSGGNAEQITDRKYANLHNNVFQNLALSVGDLSSTLFGKRNRLLLNVRAHNAIQLTTDKTNNDVIDRNDNKYVANNYLSNNARFTNLSDRVGLNISRSFIKFLNNRYEKTLTIRMDLQGEYWQNKNASDHSEQNIFRSYQRFLPTAEISYKNQQLSAYTNNYSLRYETGVIYPSIQQLAPLVDSADQYYILQGNLLLHPAYNHDLNLLIDHHSSRSKNPFQYSFNVVAGYTKDYIADDATVDESGRTVHKPVNGNNEQHLNADFRLSQAIKIKKNQLELHLNGGLRLSNIPNRLNGVWNISTITNHNHEAGIVYIYGNLLTVDLRERISLFSSAQSMLNQHRISNSTYTTIVSGSLNCTRELSLSSNVSFNNSNSTSADNISFTLWNANLFYRIGKLKSFEVKFSALDLLHENKGIYYNTGTNTLTYSRVNVLQQYFMVSFSWYPRKFGKNEKK